MSTTASGPRIQLVAEPTEEQATLMWNGMERDGEPLRLFATLAHNVSVTKRINALGHRLLHRSTLDERTREIAILRIAWRAGSDYEFGQHTFIGRQAGLDDTEIDALATTAAECATWRDGERNVVAMVDQLDGDGVVADDTWDALQARWDESHLVELLLLPGFYRMLAGLLRSARVQREDGVPGWPAGVEGGLR